MSKYKHDDYASEFRARAAPWWERAVAFAAGKGPAPASPYQAEVHLSSPESPVCRWRCVDCHGRFLRRRGGLTEGVYLQLLEDLISMGVPSVVYSGSYTDPSTGVPPETLVRLLEIGGPRWGVKIHTYGTGLVGPVRNALLDASEAGPVDHSYATLSKHTCDPEVFDRMCKPHDPAETVLRSDEENMSALFEAAETRNSPISLTLACRVTQINGSPRHLADLLRWFSETPSRVRLRFTTDYLPSRPSRSYEDHFWEKIYLAPAQAKARIDEAVFLSGFDRLDRIGFRGIWPESHYEGSRCHHALLMAAVSAHGKLHACPPIASPVYDHLAYGDLTVERFPEAWRRLMENYQAFDPIKGTERGGCPHCVASCEKQLNDAISLEILK